MLLSIILYIYGDNYDKHISLFSAVVIQMQLAEYFIWTDQKCGIVNKLATIVVRIILSLQPLVIVLGGYLFNTMNISSNILIALIIYMFAFYFNTENYYKNNKKICSLSDEDGHLQWHNFNKNPDKSFSIYYFAVIFMRLFYFTIMLFGWLLFYNTSLGIFASALITIIFLIHYIQFPKKNQWATLWCFHSSITFTIYAIVRYFDHKYNFFT
jgi:hypothetical protein